ncbi:hypothetical protein [Nannocystis punicea]|uniref:Uncharacterized protein n=1 Tax=Nannocystis punicea TaxID=2995304 RepID=A0ABY7H0M3_9BACT|nr:hypothetical protein [Nannocystis poenicansa]WAS92802.1 hypothetical protein O0S08_42045 [Nannocystis poenicansa]
MSRLAKLNLSSLCPCLAVQACAPAGDGDTRVLDDTTPTRYLDGEANSLAGDLSWQTGDLAAGAAGRPASRRRLRSRHAAGGAHEGPNALARRLGEQSLKF